VIYDVRQKQGSDRVIACRFKPSGDVERFDPPPRQAAAHDVAHRPDDAQRCARYRRA
jgi:hypothetical protein